MLEMVSWPFRDRRIGSSRGASAGVAAAPLSRVTTRTILVVTAALLTVLCASAAAVEVTVCINYPLFVTTPEGGKKHLSHDITSYAAAALLAVHHVNSRNCSVLRHGSACASLLKVKDDDYITLKPIVLDSQSFLPATALPAVYWCAAEHGGQGLIGPLTTAQAQAAALIAPFYDIPIISGTANGPALSDSVQYRMFARTIFPTTIQGYGYEVLMRKMGWEKVAILHRADAYGEGYANAFTALLRSRHDLIGVESYSIDVDMTKKSISKALTEMAERDFKIVKLVVFPSEIIPILQVAKELGMPIKEYTWLSITEPSIGLVEFGPGGAAEDPDLYEAMHGFLSINVEKQSVQEGLRSQDHVASSFQLEWLTSTLYNESGLPDPRVPEDTMEVLSWAGKYDEYPVYDSVWTLAAGLAHSISHSNDEFDGKVDGSAVMEYITSGKLSFMGESGMTAYADNGDPDVSSANMTISNVRRKGDGVLKQEVVGLISASNNGSADESEITFQSPIEWPNGLVYPKVPMDGYVSVGRAMRMIIIVSSASMGILLLLLALLVFHLVWRNRSLHKKVHALRSGGTATLDMDAPVTKMITFLHRYEASKLWSQPSKKEAGKLADYLVTHAGKLEEPDLAGQLASLPESEGSYLKYVMQLGTTAVGKRAKRASYRLTDDGSWSASYDSIGLLPQLPQDRNYTKITSKGSEPDIKPQLDDGSMPLMETHASGGETSCTFPEVLISDSLRTELGNNFFLDTITKNSALHAVSSPLAAVMAAGLSATNNNGKGVLDGLSRKKLMHYCALIEQGYPSSGYHCRTHAADVTNRYLSVLNMCGILTASNSREHKRFMLGAAVAAAIHDFEHPGVNNAFLVERAMPLARRWNDQSVAEHQSLYQALRLLEEDPSANFTAGWSRSNCKELRNLVISIVLATDMSKHFEILTQFKTLVSNSKSLAGLSGAMKWEAMDDRQRLLTLQVAMKLSDIGHCCIPLDIHKIWLQLLEEEMFQQGDAEKAADAPVSFLMDRTKPGVCCGASQVSFMDFIIIPLVTAWVEAFPECSCILDQTNINYHHWELQKKLSSKSFMKHFAHE